MHVPDHLLTPEASIATGVIAAGAVVAALAVGRPRIEPARVALAGATAAVVFGAQMVNFPVLSGTSGHLMGAALAVALLGPRLALLVMVGVLALQSLVFGDGGVTALGTNVLVMGIVPILATVGVRVLGECLGAGRFARSTVAVAAFLSVPAGALALAGLYAVGGSGAAEPPALAVSMTGIHLAIGAGEAVITVAVLSLVLLLAPGAAEWDARPLAPRAPLRAGAGLLAAALVFATALSFVAASDPDGLESVVLAYELPVGQALATGIPFLSDYGSTAGTNLALVGLIGVAAAALLTAALASTMLRRGRPAAPAC